MAMIIDGRLPDRQGPDSTTPANVRLSIAGPVIRNLERRRIFRCRLSGKSGERGDAESEREFPSTHGRFRG
jgi:hypothetical protein